MLIYALELDRKRNIAEHPVINSTGSVCGSLDLHCSKSTRIPVCNKIPEEGSIFQNRWSCHGLFDYR